MPTLTGRSTACRGQRRDGLFAAMGDVSILNLLSENHRLQRSPIKMTKGSNFFGGILDITFFDDGL